MGMLLVGMLLGAVAEPAPQPLPAVVHGVVRDAPGQQPLPGVVVTARSPNLQGEEGVVSDAEGRFHLPNLPPGRYTLSFEAPDFRPFQIDGLVLRDGFAYRVETQLRLKTQSLCCWGGGCPDSQPWWCPSGFPAVDVSSHSTGISVGEDFIRRVPVFGP